MAIGSAVDFDCPSAYPLDQQLKMRNQSLQPWKYQGYTPWQQAKTICAEGSLAFARLLSLSAAKASRGGGRCGNFSTLCLQNAFLAAAATMGIAETGAVLRDTCRAHDLKCCNFDPLSKSMVCQCNRTSLQQINAQNRRKNGRCA